MTDLETSEISSRVYKTRPSKPQNYRPLRGGATLDKHESDVTDDESFKDSPAPAPESPVVGHPEIERSTKPAKKVLRPMDAAKLIISKIDQKLKVRIERVEQAKSLSILLGKLRKLCAVENDIFKLMLRGDTLAVLLSTSEFISRFEFLTDDTLQYIVPLTRCVDLRNTAMDILLNHGCLILCLGALRYYKQNASIRAMSVELLSRSIEFVLEISQTTSPAASEGKKYCSDSYVTHQLLLHGAASSFPAVLCIFVESDIEIGTRRLLKCLKYLLLKTPADMVTNIAMSGRWSAVRDCIWVMRKMSTELQVEAAVVLTGLIASSPLVAEKVLDLRGWDDLSSRLTNPNLDISDMPPHWLEGSLRAMQMMQSKHSTDTAGVAIPRSLEEMVYNMQFADDHSSKGGVEATPGSLYATDTRDCQSKLESMPDSYYDNTTQIKPQRKARVGSIPLSKSHARLLNSPFGDPREILERTLSAKVVVKNRTPNGRGRSGRGRNESAKKSSESGNREKTKTLESVNDITVDYEYPKIVKKHAIVAERLFGPRNESEAGESECSGSALDKLSYEEKLTVMLMQVKGE